MTRCWVAASPDGSLVDPVALTLGQGLYPSLGAGEGVTLLTFESIELIGFLRPPEIRATRLSGPAPLDDPPFVVTNPANDQQSPSIASDGTRHLVAWADQRPGFDYDIYGSDRTERTEAGWQRDRHRDRARQPARARVASTGRTTWWCGSTCRRRRRSTTAPTSSALV